VLRPLVVSVEIAAGPVLVVAVFMVTLMVVGGLAYWLLLKPRGNSQATTWRFQAVTRVPVSQRTFDRASAAAATAMATPEIDPRSTARLDALRGTRGTFVLVYRIGMIGVGVVGLTAGASLLWSHTPANMNGLPGGIIVLVSLWPLLNGLVPGPSIVPVVEPLTPDLLDQIKRKMRIQVVTAEPLAVALADPELHLAGEMLRQGASLREVARAVYRQYDGLSDADKRAFELALAHYLGNRD
jgi:hypothetical protein